MKNFQVKITQVHLISPSNPTGKHQLPATTFDLMQKRDSMPYLQRIAFYPSTSEADPEKLIQSLKNSLSQVLVHFYPLAGRICFPPGQRPAIDCNDAGVEFSVAVADTSLSDLDTSQHSPLFEQLIQRGNCEATTMTGTAPILAIQVTEFNCGGVSVAWSFDHLVIDGIAMMHFMTSWSEICRGKSLSVIPNHDRWFEKRHPELTPEIDNVAAAAFRYTFVDTTANVACRVFYFDEEEVGRMKKQVAPEFTTYEAVAGHLWLALSRARSLAPTQKTRAQIAVNCRHKLVPPLPFEYFGNAVLPGVAESTVGELDLGGAMQAAKTLRDAIRSFGMDDIRSQFEVYNDNYLGQNPMAQGLCDGVDIFFGSSLRHPLYEIDFGFGRAAAVRHGRMLWDGFFFLDPSPKGGRNMEVTVHLPLPVMDAFAAIVHP